jgi:hypothetical protein
MDKVIATETVQPPKKDPLITQVDDARKASENFQRVLMEWQMKSAPAIAAGLPPPGGKPERNAQIELGEKLDKVGSDTLYHFYRAQEKWVGSGQKDHSALDEAIASLSEISDPLE